MTAQITNLGQLLRAAVERQHKQASAPSWRNPSWQYQPAATHGDSTALRERQIKRGLKVNGRQQ